MLTCVRIPMGRADAVLGGDLMVTAQADCLRTIGAGSTITREVLEGELALTRTKQKAIAGWKRPQKKSGA